MLQFIRKACLDFVACITRIEQKLDLLVVEVQVRNAQYDTLAAKVELMSALAREDRLSRVEREAREREQIIMPMADEVQ